VPTPCAGIIFKGMKTLTGITVAATIWFLAPLPALADCADRRPGETEAQCRQRNDEDFEGTYQPLKAAMQQQAAREAEAAKAECERRGGASIGMTKAQVLASCLGKPSHRIVTITAGARAEQWVYGESTYLYFVDGVLRSINTTKR
jgi:hypothetical protein